MLLSGTARQASGQVEVAGLTPAGDTLAYVVGYVTWVPSETGASYGDLDPEYLTAHYRVYLNEPDAKRVFAYIKKLQASSPVWNAEISNCTSFIGDIASFMGLKVPHRWQRPEEYVNSLKAMNGGRRWYGCRRCNSSVRPKRTGHRVASLRSVSTACARERHPAGAIARVRITMSVHGTSRHCAAEFGRYRGIANSQL